MMKTFRANELIETLWNVNLFTNAFQGVATVGINRNIVECKFICKGETNGTRKELIETLWNVNNKDVGEMTKEQMN